MAENLWQLRKQRGMSVKQLAAKAGIAIATLEGYENGDPVRASDIGKLAKVLFVDEFAIKIRSDPKPKPAPKPTAETGAAQKPPGKKERPHKMAQPGQIQHLIVLASKMGLDEEQVTAEVGRPLESLSQPEVKGWLKEYKEKLKAHKEARRQVHQQSDRPPGTRRRRAELPEGIDEFELNYLTERRDSGDLLHFVLLTGETALGKITGFSPYNILIQTEDGREMLIEKLALAYYFREAAE